MKTNNRKICFANFADLRAFLLLSLLFASLLAHSLETPDKFPSNDAWKNARQAELQTKIDEAVARGAQKTEITKIRENWVSQNRAMESGRTEALKNFIKDVYGVSDDKAVEKILDTDFEHSGTKPEKGQGRFGDIDMTPKPEAWKKINDYAKKNPDKFEVEPGSTMHIPGQEITIHNPNKNYEYSIEKGPDGKVRITEPGKGGAPVKKVDTVALRAGDQESYTSYEFDKDGKIVIEDGATVGYDKDGKPVRKPGPKIADPHLNTLDNMKKIGEHLDLDKRGRFEYMDNQSTAKAVMRTIEGAYGSDPSKWPPDVADMHKKCHQVKNGVAVEELRMIDKNAKNQFYDQMEKVVKDSYAKTSADSARRDAELAAKRDQAYNEMREAKKKMGDCVRKMDEAGLKKAQDQLKQKKADYEKISSDLTQKRSLETRSEHGVVKNNGAGILSKSKTGAVVRIVKSEFGQENVQDVESKKKISPSEFEAKLTEGTRKKLAESLKPKVLESPSKPEKSSLMDKTASEPFSGRKALFGTLGGLLDIHGAVQNHETTGEALDLVMDMNPTLKKGVQTLTAGASLLTLSTSSKMYGVSFLKSTPAGWGAVIAGAPGAIKAGAEASIDELSKWYLENPNAGDPDFFEGTKIGMRGANNFAKQYAKDTAYGLTVKPVVDVYQIAESGTGAFKAKLEKIETERRNRENKGQMLATSEKKVFAPIKDKFDRMEKDANQILDDKSSSESARQKAKALLKELKSGRNRLQWALDKQRDRDVSGDSGVDYNEEDENKKHVEYLKAQKEREQDQKDRQVTETLLATSLSEIEKKMNELNEATNSVRVRISVLDSESGATLDADVSMVGAKYRSIGQDARNGKLSFSEVPGGSYEISVRAHGYESKQGTYSFDPAKKKEYNCNFNLVKIASEDTTPAFAKLAVMVVDAETGAAIPGASIAVESPDRNYSYSGDTETGAIEFPSLASGDYFVSAGAPGYVAKLRKKIPVDPASNATPRYKIGLSKSLADQNTDGQSDVKNISDNTYVQADEAANRAEGDGTSVKGTYNGQFGSNVLADMSDYDNKHANWHRFDVKDKSWVSITVKWDGRGRDPDRTFSAGDGVICWYHNGRNSGSYFPLPKNETVSRFFEKGGGHEIKVIPYIESDGKTYKTIAANYEILVEMKMENAKNEEGAKNKKDETKKDGKDLGNDDIRCQIETLKAEGNAKLDQIRAELKKMEGKEISTGCSQCKYGGPHFWDGSGWSCKNCGATVCQPSNYPTSAGIYSQVRDEYKRRIAELEAKLK